MENYFDMPKISGTQEPVVNIMEGPSTPLKPVPSPLRGRYSTDSDGGWPACRSQPQQIINKLDITVSASPLATTGPAGCLQTSVVVAVVDCEK